MLQTRSIPARAGEPGRLAISADAGAVYPRACGGTDHLAVGDFLHRGLSPRVRGNRRAGEDAEAHDGSIPARAGEPAGRTVGPPVASVYPRACGGTIYWDVGGMAGTGLSPRVRGNPISRRWPIFGRRSIPARAGEPSSRKTKATPGTVYPRACGGTSNSLAAARSPWGLSPRVRGNREDADVVEGKPGSIPARAGEP